jgi:hypothetical protein
MLIYWGLYFSWFFCYKEVGWWFHDLDTEDKADLGDTCFTGVPKRQKTAMEGRFSPAGEGILYKYDSTFTY